MIMKGIERHRALIAMSMFASIVAIAVVLSYFIIPTDSSGNRVLNVSDSPLSGYVGIARVSSDSSCYREIGECFIRDDICELQYNGSSELYVCVDPEEDELFNEDDKAGPY